VRLNKIYEGYKDYIRFFCVYIQEAHPTDEWQSLGNLEEEVFYEQPQSNDDRAEIAQVCMLKLEIKMPMLLDPLSNEVNQKYAALPERLYVINREGMVTYQSAKGPHGFLIDDWLAALKKQIAS
jgi:hypothetical protein